MAFDPHANFAYSLVAVAPAPATSGTSLTLSAGDGALFPSPAGIGYEVTIWPIAEFPLQTNAEIVRVTAKVGDVLTIVRTQAGTSARTVLVGDQIALTITKKVIEDLEAAIQAPLAVSAGASSASLSALTFSDSNGVSFGLSDGVITGTVATNYQSPGAYLTTAALSQDSSKYAGTNGAITGGSITVNTSGVSVNLPAYLTTAMASNRGSDFVQATAVFAGTNATGTIASGGISISVNAGGGNAIRGIAAGGSTATTNTVNFSDANGVSFGFGAGGNSTVLTATVKTDYLTTAMASNRGSDFVAATAAFNGTNASGTIASNAISVSVAAQSNQSAIKALGASNTGNTSGNTGVSTGIDWVFAGTNNVTVSQSTTAGGPNTLWLSGPTVGGAQTGISGVVVSNTTYTSGTISFSNAGNITISSSVNGATQYVRLSGNPAQTVQSAIKGFGVSDTGQTAGDTGISTGIDWVVAGSQSITLSQSTTAGGPNTVWVQHPAWLTTAMASNRGSDFVQATAAFNGTNASGTIASNAISVSVATPIPIATAVKAVASVGSTGTITRYAPEDHQHAGVAAFAVSNTGNTAGNTRSQVGTLYLAASGAITASQSTAAAGNDTVWFSVAAQTNQSAIKGFGVSNTGQTAGNTGLSTGIDWVVAGSQSITLSQSTAVGGPNTVWFQHPAWLTTAMASNRGSDFVQATAVFNGTNATGTIASGAISVSVAAPIPIATAVKDVASVGSTGTITRYAPEDHQHAGVAAFAVTNTGSTAGNTRSQVGTLYLAASGNITASQSTAAAGNDTVWLSVPAQSNQTLGGYAVGNTTGQSSSSTFDARTLSFNGAGNVSVGYSNSSIIISGGSAGAASPVNFSAGTTSGNLGSVVFSDSNGVSFGLSASTITATVATYNTVAFTTVGSATTVNSVASANSVGTATRWALEDHRHAGVGGIGISTSGNTAGTTGSVLGTYWLQGSNGITVSQITSNNGSHTLNIVGPAQHQSYYRFVNAADATLTFSFGQSTSYMAPFELQQNHSFDRLRVIVSGSVAASSTQATTGGTSLSMSAITSHNIVIYSRGVGASSQSLQYVTSTQHVDQILMTESINANSSQHSVSLRLTFGSDSFTKDYSSSVTRLDWHTSHLTDLTGVKYLDVPFGVSLSPGQYWLGYGRSTTFATQANSISVATRMLVSHNSMIAISQNTLAMGMLGGGTNSSVGFWPGHGSWTTGGAAGTSSSVGLAVVSTSGSNNVLYAQLMRIV